MRSGLLELVKVFDRLAEKLDDIERGVEEIDSMSAAIDTIESGVRTLVEDAGYEYAEG